MRRGSIHLARRIFLLGVVLLLLTSTGTGIPARASSLYTWWLVRWENRSVACVIVISHQGPPTADEIEAQCGSALKTEWENTPPCLDESSRNCRGLALLPASFPGLKTATPTKVHTKIATSSIAPTTAANGRRVNWLSRPETVEQLASNRPLYLLAGRLILNGIADASACPNTGLLPNGAANACGMEKAKYEVYLWQNRFDKSIFHASQKTKVPAYLLKGMFALESQFWPLTLHNNAWDFGEFGLGQLNELGADTLLNWNPTYYKNLCLTALSREACEKEYFELSPDLRALLRGTAINQVRADCSTCSYGLDFAKADASVLVFAETLDANREQVSQVIQNAAGPYAFIGIRREDLWKFTLINYHAGPGCLYSAIAAARRENAILNWEQVSSRLEPACEDAVNYVEAISSVYYAADAPPAPTPTRLPATATLKSTATSLPTETLAIGTPTVTETLSVDPTATVSPTLGVSSTPGAPTEGAPTASLIPTATDLSTNTPAAETPTPSETLSIDATATASPTLESSSTPGAPTEGTPALETPTPTGTLSVDETPTASPTSEFSPTPSATPEGTPALETPTPTETLSVDETPTASPTSESSPTPSATPEGTPTGTSTVDETATATDYPIGTSTVTPTPTTTASPTMGVSPTPGTPTATAFPTPIPTLTPTLVPIDFVSPHEAGEIVIQMVTGARSELDAILESLPVPAQVKWDASVPELRMAVIEVAPKDLRRALYALQGNPDVVSAEPNFLASAADVPNDLYYGLQTNLPIIQAPMAWNWITSSQEVIVAVIDTGVDTAHPDLTANLWQNPAETDGLPNVDDDGNGYVDDVWGWNMVGGNNDVSDDNGHGTHLSGVIAAVGNNGLGVVGVAPNARILTVKALDANGVGAYGQVADAIVYATEQGARVINLSFGGAGQSQVLQDAIDFALQRGVIIVAAAGNTGKSAPIYPAAYPGVLAVSAVDDGLTWATFSSSGSGTALTAPGIDVYSTWPGGRYIRMSGTSVASAEAAGVAALLAGQSQFTNAVYIRDALIKTAYDLGAAGWDPYYGFGLLHAEEALKFTETGMPPVIWPTPGPSPTPGFGSGGVGAMAVQNLWGTAQSVANCTLSNSANSIDLAFNNSVTSCAGNFGTGNWTYTAVQNTTLTTIASAMVVYRFYITGWVDDHIDLEVNNGGGWARIARFEAGSPPPATLTTLSYNTTTIFTTVMQTNNATFRLRGTQVNGETDNLTIYLDEARLLVSDTLPTPTPLPPLPTPTLPARASTAVPNASDPHVHYTASADDCAACHRSHTANGIVMRSAWPEESICFTCHTSGGTGTNVQPAFTGYTNTATRFFKHDISAANGVHRIGQILGANFGGPNRHIECEDCHESHEATRDAVSGTTRAPMIQPVMVSMSGVDPVWSGPGAPSGYTWIAQAQREYQVCFKCHSSFTTLPSYSPDGWQLTASGIGVYVANGLNKLITTDSLQVLDNRDLAQEFNPNNASFHPVVAKGRNTGIPAGAFVNGWSTNSMTYCTDCHTNANAAVSGNGPHGSPRLHILDGTANYWTVLPAGNVQYLPNTGEICFKCHNYSVYVNGAAGSAFEFHGFHVGGVGSFGVSCYSCHDTHGSEQEHLINFDTSVVSPYPGYNSQTAWAINGGTGTCYLLCHVSGGESVTHGSGKSYTP
ncbi:MAG: S8 family serine peptidase [Chloroflexi bacterium]|nr:S8 family serine peptidase [Chloroflexota bacterium]